MNHLSIQPRTSDDMPKIMCAICKKPVDHVYWRRYDMTDMVFVEVKCHGDTDSMEAGSFNLYEMKMTGSLKADAFTTKRIAAPAPTE